MRSCNILAIISSLFAVNFGISQVNLKGLVTDSINNPLAFATVQLLDSTQTTIKAYGITNSDGYYNFETSAVGLHYLKANFLGFKPTAKELVLDGKVSEITIDIVLEQTNESLEEVIIDYDPSFAKVKKDTIIYNLDKALTGQEKNLKDVLEKLPGVEIDEDGKIKVNGRKITNLLIDGEPFFNGQHQLATENIDSDIIGGVTFFEKYKDFTSFEGFEKNKGTALNISLKDDAKNKLIGSIEAVGGIEERFLGHTNIFRFGDKLKLTFIGDLNNIGQEAITLNDYLELNSGIGKFTQIGGSSTQIREFNDDDTPTFLNSADNVAERRIGLGALNFVYKPTEKLRISGFSILNETVQEQLFSTERFFLDQQDLNQLEERQIDGDYFFGSIFLNADYKINPKTLLNYTLTYNPRINDEATAVDVQNTFESNVLNQNNRNEGFGLGQQFSFVKNLKKNLLFSVAGISEINNADNRLSISATEEFLNLNFIAQPSFIENRTTRRNLVGVLSSLEKKGEKLNYSFNGGAQWLQEEFDNSVVNIEDNSFLQNLDRNIRDISFGGNLFYNATSWLSLNAGLRYINYNLQSNTTTSINRLLPSGGATINFSQTNQLSLSYGLSNDFVTLRNTISGTIAESYLRLNRGLGIDQNTLFNKNSINLIFSNIEPLKGNSLVYILNFTDQNNDVVNNAFTDPQGFFINQFFLNNRNRRLLTSLNIQRKLFKSRISLNSQSTLLLQENDNLIENNPNVTNLNYFTQNISLGSNLKKNLNFKTGVELTFNNFSNSLQDNTIFSSILEPYLELIGTHFEKRLYWKFNTTIQQFNSNNDTSRTVFNVNPIVEFTSLSKKWTYFLRGRNILNLEGPEIIQNINRTNFFEERISNSLSGYLGVGAKYSF